MNVREPISDQRARMLALVGLGTFAGLWCLLSYGNIVPTAILPTPTEVLQAFPKLHTEEAGQCLLQRL